MKTCNKCGTLKEFSEFNSYRRKNRQKELMDKIYYFPSCRACIYLHRKERRATDPAYREYTNMLTRKCAMKPEKKPLRAAIARARYKRMPEHIQFINNAAKLVKYLCTVNDDLENALKNRRSWTPEYCERIVEYIIKTRLGGTK